MHYNVLSFDRENVCGIELVKSDTIEIKRRPSQKMTFKDAEKFVNALTGKKNVIIYAGKEVNDEDLKAKLRKSLGENEEGQWKAYYWEKGGEPRRSGYDEGTSLFPPSTLAILEMKDENDLQSTLEAMQKETRKWIAVMQEVERIAQKISRIDREHPYADSNQFKFLSVTELEETLGKIKEAFNDLAKRGASELGKEEEEEEEGEERKEEF